MSDPRPTIERAYKTELDPTVEQRKALERHVAAARVAHNWALERYRVLAMVQRLVPLLRWLTTGVDDRLATSAYWIGVGLGALTVGERIVKRRPKRKKVNGKTEYNERVVFRVEPPAGPRPDRAPDLDWVHAQLTAEKNTEDSPVAWLTELSSFAIREGVADVKSGYEHFFRRLKKHAKGDHSECKRRRGGGCALGEPRFRSAKLCRSYHVDQPNPIRIEDRHIHIPKVGRVRLKERGYVPVTKTERHVVLDVPGKKSTDCKSAASLSAALETAGIGSPVAVGGPTDAAGDVAALLAYAERRAPGSVVTVADASDDLRCVQLRVELRPHRTLGHHFEYGGRVCGIGVREHGGRWYVAVRAVVPRPAPHKRAPGRVHRAQPVPRVADKVVGVDSGVRFLATASDGQQFDALSQDPLLQKLERRRKLWERRMARRFRPLTQEQKAAGERQSQRWFEAKREVAKYHRRISQVRDDRAGKAARAILDTGASRIVVRGPQVAAMLVRDGNETRKKNALAPGIHAARMGDLAKRILYKAKWAGATGVEAPVDFPSTRMCSVCHHVLDDDPGYAPWTCPACGATHDREENATANLRDYSGGDPGTEPGRDGPEKSPPGATTSEGTGNVARALRPRRDPRNLGNQRAPPTGPRPLSSGIAADPECRVQRGRT